MIGFLGLQRGSNAPVRLRFLNDGLRILVHHAAPQTSNDEACRLLSTPRIPPEQQLIAVALLAF